MSWLAGEKERETLFQMQLRPYLEKVEQTFPDIQKRADAMKQRATKMEESEDKKIFEILAKNFTVEEIARLQWYSDTEEFYENYKKSLLWKKIRQDVIQRDKYQCRGCGWRPRAGRKYVRDLYSFEVHHMDYQYETMAGLDDSVLVTLCSACHKYIHFDKNGDKRPESQWESVLQQLKKKCVTKKREERRTIRLLNQLKKLSVKDHMDGLSSEEQKSKSDLERELRKMVSHRKARRQ